ncbi:MAG: hypothetical protein K5880_21365 [Hydrogenophaga sp.]|jgi:hypothetical protein|uniref:hypothetical protein n=1 Tax=Hydrogenophaga sp. TaxID=1904254 RepID=UPI00262EB0CA|nr:hypothetical protein [Hydrogenophaga sp.]MCV0441151.1 hypothetical protein [Hydrogenophaga sp.]
MLSRLVIVAAASTATGCASLVNETTQEMKIETRAETGGMVAGADCRMGNNHGSVSFKSGATVQVHRSAEDLEIFCQHPGNPDASARAISRVNGGMFGNIIIGGGIGAIIDHNRGTAYTYPSWVQLVFGKSLVFDRNYETEGQPAVATGPRLETGIAAATGGSAPSPTPPGSASAPATSTAGAPDTHANRQVTLDDLSGLMPPQR